MFYVVKKHYDSSPTIVSDSDLSKYEYILKENGMIASRLTFGEAMLMLDDYNNRNVGRYIW